ncbi:MAG: bifunctional class I SAM-dependent methyltransferase/glycosyltransferase family 2 protein [Candidatus Solibacter sp.]|nr:bifunctional class I SAM-dependent methyltransferase/glycosyltransferase family 2 protein [Candidatus Solibacter sp.]
MKLRWRAATVRHSFHVLPGESILDLGAGSGLWTEHLSAVLRGQNPITAAVFNDEFITQQRDIPNTRFVRVHELLEDLPAESFDYVVGTAILCHELYPQNLAAIRRLLKPGGQILFFEANYWNPQVALKSIFPWLGRWAGQAQCQVALRKYRLLQVASQQGYIEIEVIPFDIIHPLTPRFLLQPLQSLAFILEHAPLVRELCGTLYVWAKKPGDEQLRRPKVCLAEHQCLHGAVSVVIPCHNEEMNVPRLVDALLGFYGPYIKEIVVVNDNSSDRTAEVTRELGRTDERIRLFDRTYPNGVGLALRDGYSVAAGQYILSMDSDFVQIVPEFRDLFDVIAAGHDGAIGSRFSHDSLLINYPFAKIMANRTFHLLAKLLFHKKMRDVSNNLKLYRADIFKTMTIDQPHFAANAETGLRPLLAGYDIREVPISWINRTVDMGSSTFNVAKLGPSYFRALVKMLLGFYRARRHETNSPVVEVADDVARRGPT